MLDRLLLALQSEATKAWRRDVSIASSHPFVTNENREIESKQKAARRWRKEIEGIEENEKKKHGWYCSRAVNVHVWYALVPIRYVREGMQPRQEGRSS